MFTVESGKAWASPPRPFTQLRAKDYFFSAFAGLAALPFSSTTIRSMASLPVFSGKWVVPAWYCGICSKGTQPYSGGVADVNWALILTLGGVGRRSHFGKILGSPAMSNRQSGLRQVMYISVRTLWY